MGQGCEADTADLSSLACSYEAEFKALRKDREFYQKIIKMEDAG